MEKEFEKNTNDFLSTSSTECTAVSGQLQLFAFSFSRYYWDTVSAKLNILLIPLLNIHFCFQWYKNYKIGLRKRDSYSKNQNGTLFVAHGVQHVYFSQTLK